MLTNLFSKTSPKDKTPKKSNLFSAFSLEKSAQPEQTFQLQITETTTTYQIKASLKNVKREHISLSIFEGHLVICVKSAALPEQENSNFMSRGIYLSNILAKKGTAQFSKGILFITFPKRKPGNSYCSINID